MKKDIDKLFSKSIETYYFLLLIVVIIKLLGGNYFAIVYTNKTINMINDFIMYWRLENIWYAISLYIYAVIIIGITTHDNSKNVKNYCLKIMPLIILVQSTKTFTGGFGIIIDYFYLFLLAIVYTKIYKNNKIVYSLKEYITIMLLYTFIQIFSMITRDQDLAKVINNFYVNFILNLDCLLIMIIIYKTYFMKGGISLCQMVVSYGSQKLVSLRNSLKDLLEKLHDKKHVSKEDKITNAIYIPLYILWNLFTMCVIVAIAFLNDAFIEAIFITVAFWVNKYAFGKPFHFKSVAICFAFSSFTYYLLTRITFKTETSFFIPIFLGVALSYITSHFIKKNTKLYKGMSEEDLYKTVSQVEQDRLVIKMLKEYYCDRLNDKTIATRNYYSVDTVRKKRQLINKKLRDLQ